MFEGKLKNLKNKEKHFSMKFLFENKVYFENN